MPKDYCLIDDGHHRFLITDSPTDAKLSAYEALYRKYSIDHVICTCERAYDKSPLKAVGITVIDLPIVDGDVPSKEILMRWREILRKLGAEPSKTIAIHCVSGLGRAPMMVALALVDNGMKPLDAVALIRKHRHGALNTRQLDFIINHKPLKKDRACCIM